jgi:hypothetical protein
MATPRTEKLSLIIVKLVPTQPTLPSTLGTAIENLTITAYGLTVQDSSKGVKLGTAKGLAPQNGSLEIVAETDDALDKSIQALGNSIIQDIAELPDTTVPVLSQIPILQPSSVATAVIIVKPLNPLPSTLYDVRFEFKAGDLNIPDSIIDYNIQVVTHDLVTDQSVYSGMTASTYFSLPVQILHLPSNSAFIALDPNGRPPEFSQLRNAIDIILSKDHPITDKSQKSRLAVRDNPLTPAQSLQIACEITWNRSLYPIPTPGGDIYTMYTILLDSNHNKIPVSTEVDNSRKKFESDLQNYHLQHDSEAARLAGYVTAASAAVACERLTSEATLAGITFPVETDSATPSITFPHASVVLQRQGSSPDQLLKLFPSFTVPAAYFYALGTSFPAQVSVQQRYNTATMATEDQLRTQFQTATDTGILEGKEGPITTDEPSQSPKINYNQAARRLVALGSSAIGPRCDVSSLVSDSKLAATSPPPVISTLLDDWLLYDGLTSDVDKGSISDNDKGLATNIDVNFWRVNIPKYPESYVTLLLQAITQGEASLVAQIKSQLNVHTVKALVGLKEQQWLDFFGKSDSTQAPLPDFTLPGTIQQRTNSFVQRIQKFFVVQMNPVSFCIPDRGQTPVFSIPTDDTLQEFLAEYKAQNQQTAFDFSALNSDAVDRACDRALLAIFPDDPRSRSWLKNALEILHNLVVATSVCPSKLKFSVIEALYSRGFTTANAVNILSETEFQSALAGTIAYPYAIDIFRGFISLAPIPPQSSREFSSTFAPVNSSESLTDQAPPPNLSPLGPIAYLHELLEVALGDSTIGTLLSSRRGSPGKMQATLANLESQVPRIDIVNESLEALGSDPSHPKGVFLDTNPKMDQSSLITAIPEHSSPAPAQSPAVYESLKSCFTSANLPYSQALDVSRSILSSLGTDRFETMRHFHKDITELAVDANSEPSDFQKHLWRYPVRFDIALEYLHISSEEYAHLFSGSLSNKEFLESVLGLSTKLEPPVVSVAWFLKFAGLKYHEFIEVWQCKYVAFEARQAQHGGKDETAFPLDESYESGELQISLEPSDGDSLFRLRKLFVFIRLWRILRTVDGPKISFNGLADICATLGLFNKDSINAEFVRQLAALMMLRDDFEIPLAGTIAHTQSYKQSPVEKGLPRLLSLWQGPKEQRISWNSAVSFLLDHIEKFAKARYNCHHRKPVFKKDLENNLTLFSLLAGFNGIDTWYAKPTSTLRFAEVLSKVYASPFTLGEISLLFTADEHIRWDDPFPLPNILEATVEPLKLPDDDFSLLKLRKRLIKVEVNREDVEACGWDWRRIKHALHDLGYVSSTENDPLESLGEHFFPAALELCGQRVIHDARIFKTDLPVSATTPSMWNTEPRGPFHYDADGAGQLCLKLPLCEDSVIDKLRNSRQFSNTEITAFQNLYFAPRAVLAPFASIFSNFDEAVHKLVHEPSEDERFRFFQFQFALFHSRCEIIADHLAEHVSASIKGDRVNVQRAAWCILRRLFADENSPLGEGWESNSGSGAAPQSYTWEPHFSGGAFASILGLVGTGLLGEFEVDGKGGTSPTKVWRHVTGDLNFFGHHQNEFNAPIPTIIPSPDLQLLPLRPGVANAVNGFVVRESNEEPLGGGQCFRVSWRGALLVENSGEYAFYGGHPRPDDEKPDFENVRSRHRWLFTIQRGDKSWTILNHRWEAHPAHACVSSPLFLHRGVYHMEIHFEQNPPNLSECHRERTGFQIKYQGPDTEDHVCVVPAAKLFRESKTQTLGYGLQLSASASAYLDKHYTSSLRDIRRTYQRAFKGLLFVSRFNLSAELHHQDHFRESELNYLLQHPADFLGSSYYRGSQPSSSFSTHHAYFDFNFMPVTDNYDSTEQSSDQRARPTPQRKAALFDWWERIFDYCKLRKWVRKVRSRQCWMLFHEATEQVPQPGQLLRYLVTDVSLAPLIQKYFSGAPESFDLSTADLICEPWAIRAWHSGSWLHHLKKRFLSQSLAEAQPWLWSSENPNILIEKESGNHNLSRFFQESFSSQGNYDDIQKVNDGLRLRARAAMLTYLCDKDRVVLPFENNTFAQSPLDLTNLLLLNVEVRVHERTTRIEDTVDSIYRLVSRVRLGLEPSIVPTAEFIETWDTKFKNFKLWEAQKRRKVFRENWIHWDELHEARKSEGFRLLENELRRNVLTIPKPGGSARWSAVPLPNSKLLDLQNLELPSLISSPANTAIDGLNVLALPDHSSLPSLVSAIPGATPPLAISNGASDGKINPPGSELDIALLDHASEVPQNQIPLWMKAAIKMGVQFVMLAAASKPPLDSPNGRLINIDSEDSKLLTIDKFYFWVTPSSTFRGDDVTQNADLGATAPGPSSLWDPDRTRSSTDHSLEELLLWNPEPSVHLNWCRIRFGRFGTPRRSDEAYLSMELKTQPLQLKFSGRAADSLTFGVNGKDAFRYDMPTDTAAVLSTTLDDNPIIDTTGFPSSLTAYPFFIYFDPGAPLIPPSNFSTILTVAGNLRSHCQFESALKWYEMAFNPLRRDNSWEVGSDDKGSHKNKVKAQAVLIEYLETLMQWADSLLLEETSDASQRALTIFNTIQRILGPRPRKFSSKSPDNSAMTIETFSASTPALNPRLIALYDRMADSKFEISPADGGQHPAMGMSFDKYQISHSPFRRHPYRFMFILPKAMELVSYVRSLGSALLSAFERGDSEYLASLQTAHERQLTDLTLESRKNQFRDSDWEMQGLQQALAGAMCRLTYNQNLIRNDLNAGEIAFTVATALAIDTRIAAGVATMTGEAMTQIPDVFVGGAGAMGSPLEFQRVTGGSSLSSSFSMAASYLTGGSEIANTSANLSLTQSGWDRRRDEWRQAVDATTIEIQQLERQKLASDRRKAVALRELNTCQRQIEHSAEIQDFMRDKTAGLDLYLFLQQETAILYRQAYDLALRTSLEAQHMFYYERRDVLRDFIPLSSWSNLHEGLMAGERLEMALHTMERAYIEANCREHELTKQLSLSMQFPAAFLLLKTTGKCEIDVPEWMFDLDYPGQYMRRIRNVGVTIPCVIGPYTGIHCRLELLSSCIRVNSSLPEASRCSPHCSGQDCGYKIQSASDSRFVQQFGACESIATSTGQGDSGLFELSFRDDRYLPFEFSGAVSRWRIELPPENNQFELSTLTDLVMTLNYTSRDGGERLRVAANEVAQRKLPGDGWKFFDLRYQFPDAWNMFHRDRPKKHEKKTGSALNLQFNRNLFPFLNGHREIQIVRQQLLIQSPEYARTGEYIRVKYHKARHPHQNGFDEDEIVEFDCVLAAKYPGLYHGALDLNFKVPSMSSGGRDEFGYFSFPSELCVDEVREAYILVQYEYSGGRKGDGHKNWAMREQEDIGSKRRRYDHWDDGMGGLDGEEVRMAPDL